MSKDYLIREIKQVENAMRIYRLRAAQSVLDQPELFPYLLEIVFDTSDKIAVKATWVLEFVCIEKLEWLLPHMEYFTGNLLHVQNGSAVRPLAKICEYLSKAYHSKDGSNFKQAIKEPHIEAMVEVCFDWLISDHRVAVKVFAMETLYHFGKSEDWIHPELASVVKQQIITGSPAYQSRGKKILRKLQNQL